MRFSATVTLFGKTATGMVVPDKVVESLGAGKRPPVTVTLNGFSYRTTVSPMGGQFLIPLSADRRKAAGVAAGDKVEVTIELDAAPRVVEVPADLEKALLGEPAAREHLDGLSFTHKNEWVRWITEAKKPETRSTRVAKTVEALREGKKTR